MDWKFPGLALLLWAIALTLWTTVFTGVTTGPWGKLAAAICTVLAATAVGFIPEVRKSFLNNRSESNIPERSIQPPVLPGILPRDVRSFIGRVKELERLEHMAAGGSVVVTAIDGMAGIGKTALAIHAAHLMLDAFPDGHLYADLRGYSDGQEPAQAGEILLLFLPHLGIPLNEIPVDLEQRSALLRGQLSSRRIIMVLDNVVEEQQVRPLLPGTGSSFVLITSRHALGGLDVDERVNLDILTTEEAIALITSRLGQARASSDPEGVRKIAETCGCLPLAVWISSQLLVSQPAWPISHLVELLANEQERLERLEIGDRQVRSAFEVSYRGLVDQDARVFRFLGLYPGPDFSDDAVGKLAALDTAEAAQVLDRLARAHLVIPDADRRFRMHDLLRLFAREMSLLKDSDEIRYYAMIRLVSYFENLLSSVNRYLEAERAVFEVQSAGSVASRPFNHGEALVMFQTELPNVMAVFKLVADQHLYREVCTIFDGLTAGLWLLWRPDDILASSQLAADAARALGDHDCEAKALNESGKAYVHKGDFDRALACHGEALEIRKREDDAAGEARILVGLGYAYRVMGQLGKAVECHQRALKFSRKAGNSWLEQHVLNNLGLDYQDQANLDSAVRYFQEGLSICRKIGDKDGEGHHLNNLGITYKNQEQFAKAVECMKGAAEVYRAQGDKYGEGGALMNMGLAYHATNQARAMIACFQEAAKLFRQIGQYEQAAVLEGIVISNRDARRRWLLRWRPAKRSNGV